MVSSRRAYRKLSPDRTEEVAEGSDAIPPGPATSVPAVQHKPDGSPETVSSLPPADAEEADSLVTSGRPDGAGTSPFQALFDAMPPEVFRAATDPLRPEERVAVCMDDRNPDDGVYSAGAMILFDTEAAVEQIQSFGITAIKSHPGCGAGAVLAQRAGLPMDEGDRLAVERATAIAEQAGIRYAGASTVDPSDPHTAEATLVFLDCPARRSILRGYLPRAFYVSGFLYPNSEALISELLLSVRLAVGGDSGAGAGFSQESPFFVVFIAKDARLLDKNALAFQARVQAVMPVNVSERVLVTTVH